MKPFANVTIEAVRPWSAYEAARAQWEDRKPAPASTALSDARGRFRITLPEPGLWGISVQVPGMISEKVVFSPVFEDTELETIYLGPERRARIRVVDAEGNPVPGARVIADSSSSARTGPDGEASIPVMPVFPGLAVLADGHSPAVSRSLEKGLTTVRLASGCRRAFQVVDPRDRPAAGVAVQSGLWTLGVADDAGRVELDAPCHAALDVTLLTPEGQRIPERLLPLRDGEPSEVRFRLPPAAAKLEGRVLEASRRTPIVGALVWSRDAPGDFARTGEGGRFSFRRPVAKEAQLTATADGVVFAWSDAAALGPGETLTVYLQPAASIAGTVIDEAGHPVEGAEVTVDGGSFPRGGGRSVTDGKGAFKVRLPPGEEHDLVVSRRGDFFPVTSTLAAFRAREERRMTLTLRRAGSATARLVDGNGRPVAGARAVLSSPEVCPADRDSLNRVGCTRESLSDAGGGLLFDTLPPGKYALRVYAPGFAPVSIPEVEVRRSRAVASFGTLRLSPGAMLEGRVVDSEDRPVRGASIYSRGFDDDPSGISEVQAETGEDGRFVIADFIPDSRVSLLISGEGTEGLQVGGIEVPTREPVTFTLRRSKPAPRISCTVRDENGVPIAGASVSLLTAEIKRMLSFTHSYGIAAETDAAGRFERSIDKPGIVTLQVRADGYLPRELDFEIPEGEGTQALEVVLRSAPARIAGQLTGPDGEPIAGTYVHAFRKTAVEKTGLSIGPVSQWPTDSGGRFHLEGLTEELWTVAVDVQGYRRERRDVQLHAGENRLEIRLERGAEVEGEVVDPAGRPVPGAQLSLQSKEPSQWFYFVGGVSDAAGHFLLQHAEAGLYALKVEARGFRPSEPVEVAVAESPVRGLRVVLEREPEKGTVRGRVLGLDAKQLAEMKQVTASLPPSSGAAAPVDARGEFHLDGLAPGEWTVSARTVHRQVEVKVDLAEGGEARADLEFSPGITVSGRVLRRGVPVPGVWIRAVTGPPYLAVTVCNQHGEFHLENIDPGAYHLEIFGPENTLFHMQTVDLRNDRWVEIELPSDRLTGRVVTAEGSPVAWADVALKTLSYASGQYETARTRTGVDGSFTFQDVAAQTYLVTATREGLGTASAEVRVEEGGDAEVRLVLAPRGAAAAAQCFRGPSRAPSTCSLCPSGLTQHL